MGCVSMRTSGKAPLEKTLHGRRVSWARCSEQMAMRCTQRRSSRAMAAARGSVPHTGFDGFRHSHQQTGFTAGTVADDDELSADFSHGVVGGFWEMDKKRRLVTMKAASVSGVGGWRL